MASTVTDHKFMKVALGLARRGLGNVAPNPAVGCVIVKDGQILGRGWTQPGGRPHAETEALAQAGKNARGADAYVTLEPCAHTGQTGPCAEALVASGVARCVIATGDPDPRVAGQGIKILRASGVLVDTGVCEEEAKAINVGFFLKTTERRPLFTLKLATSLDGKIALANGESKWITGPEARTLGHKMRATHDAILVGINTVLADNPSLDCRLPGLENRSPVPIILDSQLRLQTDHRLVQAASSRKPIVFHTIKDAEKESVLTELGVELVHLANTRDVKAVGKELASRGLTRILVEGGGQVHASFLQAGFADRVEHFMAGKVLGGDGKPAIAELGLASLDGAPHLTRVAIRPIGKDILASYIKAE